LKQTPDALHVSAPLQKAPSLHALKFGSFAVQLPAASLQLSAQFPSPSGPGQGLPAWLQVPPPHVSVPLQKIPSLHDTVLFVPPHAPPEHWSLDVHTLPSLHALRFGSFAVQVSLLSLQLSAQLLSPSGPGQGSPVWLHAPPAQVSVPLQNKPSLHETVLLVPPHTPPVH
jgi:hypothetical protein